MSTPNIDLAMDLGMALEPPLVNSIPSNQVDVLIIGGGISGIEAAEQLYTSGVTNIVLLEAQDYLGGRIKTLFMKDDDRYPLEMGATWIHGLTDNPIYSICTKDPTFFQQKKEKLFAETDGIYFADECGHEIDPELCNLVYKNYDAWNVEAKVFWHEGRKHAHFHNYTEFILNKFEESVANDSEALKAIKRSVLNRRLKSETAESGSSEMDLISLNQYGSYVTLDEVNLEFPGSFSKLVKYLSNVVPAPLLKLNHPVKQISLCESERSEYNLQVDCWNGTHYRAKHVIVTVSLNYLKANYSEMFSKNLQCERKVQAMNRCCMDTVNKIWMIYEENMSFFPSNIETIHPIYLNDDQDWVSKAFSFDRFYDNALLVWITGKEARSSEKLSDEEFSNTITNVLKKLLANDKIPKPKQIIRSNWYSNPYILGSYSYMGLDNSVENIKQLAEPTCINKVPKVLFAGEHTHENFYSTVHGAYLSGGREAKRIIDYRQDETRRVKNKPVSPSKL